MAKTFSEDDSLVQLANKVVEQHKLDYMNAARVRYLLVDPFISKTCHARCIRANDELKHFANVDYLIEFSKSMWDSIDDATREILMYHEMLHILIKVSKGKQSFALADHNVKDFSAIIKKYGVDWFEQLKDIISATQELDGADRDKITV